MNFKIWRNQMKKALIVIIFLALVCNFAFSAEPEKLKELSLKDAIYYALKNNLDLQVQQKDTEYAYKTRRINKSVFIPNLSLTLYNTETNTPSTDFFSGADVANEKQSQGSLNVSELLPLGGTIQATIFTRRYETNNMFTYVTPILYSSVTLNFTQPLLKGFGTIATKYQIYISKNECKISELQLKQQIIDLIYNVESAYWELVYAHQNLEATKMSLERAKDLLEQNEIKVKVGTIAPLEKLSSQAEVARNESSLISAEQTIQTREEALKRILNMSKETYTIIPTDNPKIKNIPIDFEEFILEALKNRNDIQQAKLNLKNYNIGVKYYKNQRLPDLQLEVEYYAVGNGGKRKVLREGISLVDPNYNPDTDIIGYSERTLWDALKDVYKNLYKNYSVQLQLQIPLSFARENAELAQAKIDMKRGLLQLKNVENTVYSEVREIIKELESNRKLVEADKIALHLAEETLKAEEKKLSVGLSTNFEVLQYQQQFASAQTQLLRSTINLALTQARINQVLNRTFNEYNIEFNDIMNTK